MIYVMGLDGKIIASSVSNINQGENGASEIILLAPFPSYYTVRVKVKLPNGLILPASLAEPEDTDFTMTSIDTLEDFSYVTAPNGAQVGYNAWKLTVLYPITQNFGNVKISFVLTATNGVTKTSTEVDLTINKGTPSIPVTVSPDDLNTISAYLAQANQAEQNAEGYASDAEGYAQGAETSQDNALRSAIRAESAKNDAQASAAQAAESAAIAANAALANKLDKVTTNSTGDILLYGVANGGAQEMVRATNDATSGGRVIMSTNDGQINAPNQLDFVPKPDQLVSRRWVDNEYGDLHERVTTLEDALITYDTDDSTAYKKTAPLTAANIAIVNSIKGKAVGGVGANKFDPYWLSGVFDYGFEVMPDGSIVGQTNRGDDSWYPLTINLPAGTWTISETGNRTLGLKFENSNVSEFTISLSEPSQVMLRYTIFAGFTEYSFKVMLNEGSTALPFEPYEYAPAAVTEIKTYSANLIPFPYYYGGEGTVKVFGGITYTIQENRGISITGNANGSTSYTIAYGIDLGQTDMGGFVNQGATNNSYSVSTRLYYNPNTKAISCSATSGTSANDVIYPMANKGSRLLPYVPYFDPITSTIPTEITSLPGYGYSMPDGTHPNVLDLDAKKYIRNTDVLMSGDRVYGFKVLAEPIEIDVSQWLTDLMPNGYFSVTVQGGGEIEFVNDYSEPVPSEVTFLLAP